VLRAGGGGEDGGEAIAPKADDIAGEGGETAQQGVEAVHREWFATRFREGRRCGLGLDDLPVADEEIRAGLLDTFDRQQQIGAAARLVARHLILGHSPEALIAAHTLLREDAGFHAYQMLETGVRQFHEWGNCDQGRHILIAVARYLAAYFPTQRALLHMWRTQATTVSLCTSRPAQCGYRTSIVPPPHRRVGIPVEGNLELVLAAVASLRHNLECSKDPGSD
jgi:hypothetical protein